MEDLFVVGKNVKRVDAVEKVTGKALYGTDVKFAGMLYGKVLRSPLPHARILHIDTSRAERVIGVRAVATGKDLIATYGGCVKDQPSANRSFNALCRSPLMDGISGFIPVQISICAAPCRASISRPSIVRHPRSSASRKNFVRKG